MICAWCHKDEAGSVDTGGYKDATLCQSCKDLESKVGRWRVQSHFAGVKTTFSELMDELIYDKRIIANG